MTLQDEESGHLRDKTPFSKAYFSGNLFHKLPSNDIDLYKVLFLPVMAMPNNFF